MTRRSKLPIEHNLGLMDIAPARLDYVQAAYVAGWRYDNRKLWVSPCGNFIEETARAACRIDGVRSHGANC